MKIFNVAGDFESEQDAVEWAKGFVFHECETEDYDIPNKRFICTVQGDVDVYYDFVGDYYFFVEQEGEQSC